MPYGSPLGMVSFRCVSCRAIHCYDVPRPYCSLCGAKQPDRDELEAKGLIIYASSSGTPSYTSDIKEMNSFLHRHKGKPIALWRYIVSHSELELRLRNSGSPNGTNEPWLNTLILCSATELIQIPELRWSCELAIEEEQEVFEEVYHPELGHYTRNYYLLVDKPAKIKIKCRSIGMFYDVKPGL